MTFSLCVPRCLRCLLIGVDHFYALFIAFSMIDHKLKCEIQSLATCRQQEVIRNLVKRYVAAMIRSAKTDEGLTEENFKVSIRG